MAIQPRSPHNELQGMKRQSSVLVRGFSALEIAKQTGLVSQEMDEIGFVAWLKQPAVDAAASASAALAASVAALSALQAQVAVYTFGVYETVGTGAPQSMVLPDSSIPSNKVHIFYNGLLQPKDDHSVVGGAVRFQADPGTFVAIMLI